MKLADPRILTINGGSSSIKFALFEAGEPLRRILGSEFACPVKVRVIRTDEESHDREVRYARPNHRAPFPSAPRGLLPDSAASRGSSRGGTAERGDR
jgi:hypothetical protein